jgi:hypothetical protein
MKSTVLAARTHAARQRIALALPELAVRLGVDVVSLPTAKDPAVEAMLQFEAVADFMDAALAVRAEGEGATTAGAASSTSAAGKRARNGRTE